MRKNIKRILLKVFFAVRAICHTVIGVWLTTKEFKATPTVYLIGTPEHDNIGDHAIALAEIQFIKKYFPNYEIVEIAVEQWRKYKINLLLKCKKSDMFFVTGGGNMGNIYRADEVLKRFVIKNFPNNLVVIFPQTIYYTKDKKGTRDLIRAKKIYNKHNHLIICAREKVSYEFLEKNFCANVYLCPDIVFSMLNIPENTQKDSVVGVCLRKDFESLLSNNQREDLKSIIEKEFSIEEFNTCHHSSILQPNREKEFYKLLDKISRYELVVTDRLHAVIFSVISNTPCIAISPKSAKISSTFDWVQNNRVVLLKNIENIEETINKDVFSSKEPFTTQQFMTYYENLAELIKKELTECDTKKVGVI